MSTFEGRLFGGRLFAGRLFRGRRRPPEQPVIGGGGGAGGSRLVGRWPEKRKVILDTRDDILLFLLRR